MIESKYIVLDNVIPRAYQDDIESVFLGDNSMPWYFGIETTQENERVEVTSVMYHMAYYFKRNGACSEIYNRVKPALWTMIERAGLPFHEFLQIRAIIQFPVITERTHNFIHTDVEERNNIPYYTGVYYVNDNTDGDTVLFDELSSNIPHFRVQENYRNFQEIHRVNPKKGRVTIFDGQRYHSSTLPTQRTRSVLNFSWY